MNFFKVLISLCSGTAVFPRLTGMPVWRAFLHLFLLIVLCSIGVAAGSYFFVRSDIYSVTERFFDRTGEIAVTPASICLEKDAGHSRGYKLSRNFRFDYFASKEDFEKSTFPAGKEVFGLLCFRNGLFFWSVDAADPDSGKFRSFCIPCELLYKFLTDKNPPFEELLKFTREQQDHLFTASRLKDQAEEFMFDDDKKQKIESDEKPFVIREKDAALQVSALAVSMSLASYVVEVIFLLLLVLVFFILAQYLRGKAVPHPVPLKTIAVTTVYATFPPLIIATIFRGMHLSFFTFQTVFFIAFFIYQIFAFNAVFQHFNPGRGSSPDDNSDF